MAASDLVSVGGQVMEYTYIPTGIKREMVRSGVDCPFQWQVSGMFIRRKQVITIAPSHNDAFPLATNGCD